MIYTRRPPRVRALALVVSLSGLVIALAVSLIVLVIV
jgi:CHASE1-domain containing sensor protein